jgi:hypothetical protein
MFTIENLGWLLLFGAGVGLAWYWFRRGSGDPATGNEEGPGSPQDGSDKPEP